ncbi:MAG: rhomboid family intramembrane serine protease [Paludibacteraceae bacterium]|nr:rhomboid family intramembrane serine protease [Paludibacteraceae bacterium]
MRNLPVVTRYLLIANLIIFLLSAILERDYAGLLNGLDLNDICGLHYMSASSFHWWQPFTYMFLHANFTHIFCNMFAVLIFGPLIEREWGGRRFLVYYLVCGLGAAAAQEGVWALMLSNLSSHYSAISVANYANQLTTIGASGAVFGILLAFGWLFPDEKIYLYFILPMRARTFVILYALIELFAGLGSVAGTSSDNVAHFAHLGGLIFGYLLILYWKNNNWREPKFFEWLDRLKDDHERLDSTDDHYKDYHYHKRV